MRQDKTGKIVMPNNAGKEVKQRSITFYVVLGAALPLLISCMRSFIESAFYRRQRMLIRMVWQKGL
jgi:hypothetical protein